MFRTAWESVPMVAFVVVVLSGACSSVSSDGETGGRGLEPKAAGALLARAAAVPAHDLEDILRLGAGIRPDDLRSLPFTFLVMTLMPSQVQSESLRWPRLGSATTPQDYSAGILAIDDDWKSILNPETIRSVACESGPDEATGSATFAVGDIIEGRLRFRARRMAQGWEVFEISIPASSLRNYLDVDGVWRCSLGD